MNTSSFLAGIALLATFSAAGSTLAGDLLPYRGTVAGAINGDFLGNLDSSISHQGLHVGRGTQTTTSIDLGAVVSLLSGVPAPIAGTATTSASNGDELFLNFILVPSGQTPGGDLTYTGSYEITGGTGRFNYAAAGVTGNLGQGQLNGVASLVFTGPTTLTITFQHSFDGTLARPVGK